MPVNGLRMKINLMKTKTTNDRRGSWLLAQAQKDAEAIMGKLESIAQQARALPSFKGKSALIHKAVSAWNRTMTLSVNIRDEQYDQQRKGKP
jgi:hypothetical protein